MRQLALLIASVALSSSVLANEPTKYTCTLHNAERIIEITYSSDKTVPCTVNYNKDGTTQSLWHYETTEGQCEVKAAEFVEKQKSWGWNCSQDTATTATAQ